MYLSTAAIAAENKDLNLKFGSRFELIVSYFLRNVMIIGPRDRGDFPLFGYGKTHATVRCYEIELSSIDTTKWKQ